MSLPVLTADCTLLVRGMQQYHATNLSECNVLMAITEWSNTCYQGCGAADGVEDEVVGRDDDAGQHAEGVETDEEHGRLRYLNVKLCCNH